MLTRQTPFREVVNIHKYHILRKIKEDGTSEPTSFYYDTKAMEPTEFKECKNCKFLPICMGGCAFVSILKHGTPNAPGCMLSPYCEAGLRFYYKLGDKRDIYLNLTRIYGSQRVSIYETKKSIYDFVFAIY